MASSSKQLQLHKMIPRSHTDRATAQSSGCRIKAVDPRDLHLLDGGEPDHTDVINIETSGSAPAGRPDCSRR